MAEPTDRERQLKLYLIEKAQREFGGDAVSRLTYDGEELNLYFYIPPNQRNPVERMEEVFDPRLFDDAHVLSKVMVGFARGRGSSRYPDEQLYQVTLIGPLTEMADNVEKNDASVFRAAQESHSAQAVLRREESRTPGQRGMR